MEEEPIRAIKLATMNKVSEAVMGSIKNSEAVATMLIRRAIDVVVWRRDEKARKAAEKEKTSKAVA